MNTIDKKLSALGIQMDMPAAPVANYLPCRIAGNSLYISGQLPMAEGRLAFEGKVGGQIDLETAQQAARLCAINILKQVRNALDGFDRLENCLKLGGFVNCGPDFQDHASVINGASDLMVDVMGDAGRHARAAVGVASLPLGAPVEIDAVFSLR